MHSHHSHRSFDEAMLSNGERLDRMTFNCSTPFSISGLRDQFIGERCFIIGNGPSLNKTDLMRLQHEFTFGLNRIYLNYPNMGFEPTFYACVNSNVINQFADEIDRVNSIKFVTARAREHLKNYHNTFFFRSIPEVGFNENLNSEEWYEGWTVTYCAMQVAFHLGFSQVILVGVDHYFQKSGTPDTAVVENGADVNHFHPNYFGKGVVWEYPNLERSEQSYQIAKDIYERCGREIVDATVGGHLQVFSKCDYDAVTSELSQRKPPSLFLEFQAMMKDDLIQQEKDLVKQHPHPHAIFLPTEKIEPSQRVSGLRRVIDIYSHKFDSIYSAQLKALREQCKGKKRAFVIGNGPSLNKTDLSLLKDEITFGVNGIFLKFSEVGFKPTFYVVEDHLVAEDRQDAINALSGPIKIFPIYLAYCLEEGEDTVFYNHVPRKSYPDGYDFSTDASDRTYSGCTVTFSCLQLAYYFGFEEIYLIGVDCDYEIPKDVEEKQEYNVSTLDMKSDDTNHFHPDYFGKGFRWHDPQADKMREAYKEARKVTDANGVTIHNATVGGKLEVFPRVDYYSLFEEQQLYPRILLIDMTRIGDQSATGQVKQSLLGAWKAGQLLQVYTVGGDEFGLHSNQPSALMVDRYTDAAALMAACQEFAPDVLYYRPVADRPRLHEFACNAIATLKMPYVIHIMDDWPERLLQQNPALHAQMDRSLRQLLEGAAAQLSICKAMSQAFEERYGVTFAPIANCVVEAEWQTAIEQTASQKTAQRPFTIRYVGSLAEDMTLESILDVGRAVSALQFEHSVRLEIHTRKLWRDKAEQHFSGLSGVQFYDSNLSIADYRKVLTGADCLLIAYNFDANSIRYVKYSMANKLPECLASANPVLVYGPMEVATVAYAAEIDGTQVVGDRNPDQLKAAIVELIGDPERAKAMGKAAQAHAFTHHSASRVQTYFYGLLRSAARQPHAPVPGPTLVPIQSAVLGPFERDRHAHFDETQFIAKLLTGKGAGSTMIDVGAHHGGSLRHFVGDGWKVYAFEPDPSNRQALLKKVKDNPLVVVDVRAVSDRAGEILPFFTSEESTGISGLSAFRETHQETCQVVTTTVNNICEEHQLSHVDFLKIDTEGFDWMVLKGVPWDRIQPDVIECEFEDRKTVPLGYTFDDIAQYLVDHGYSVFVSEWHPVIRYGIKHDWFRLVPYPCTLASPDSWGNLLAFRTPPPDSTLTAVAQQLVKTAASSVPKPHQIASLSANSPNASPPPHEINRVSGAQDTMTPQALNQPPLSVNGASANGASANGASVNGKGKGSGAPPASSPQNGQHRSAEPPSQPAAQSISAVAHNQSEPMAVESNTAQLGVSLLKRIARYYKRWPLAVAVVAAGLNSAAMVDALPFRWAFMGGGTALMLFLIGHAASKADYSLGVADQAQNSANDAQNSANDAQSTINQAQPKLTTAVNKGQRALDRLKETKALVNQVSQQANTSVMTANQAIAQSKASVNRANQAINQAERALEQANQATGVAKNSAEKATQATQKATQAAQQSQQAERVVNQLKRSNTNNVTLFQPFNRQLSADHISTFENFWLPALNLDLNARSLGYLAHRICLAEDVCSGRLATSVEDMLLRILVTRSVSSKSLSILEIGSLFGINLGILYETCRDYFETIHLNAIDPLDGYYGESKFDLITNVPVTRSVFEHNMRSLDVADEDVTLIQGLSTESNVLEAAGRKQYNLFVIDGDHSYTGVKFDFEHYLAAIDVGGYIIFDDYSTDHWPDIAEYVDQEVKHHPCLEFVGASWRTAVFKVIRKDLK